MRLGGILGLTLLAVVALNAAPVLGVGALLGHVTDSVTVAALHDALVRALALAMANLIAVEAFTSAATTATATTLARLRTLGLDVAVEVLAYC